MKELDWLPGKVGQMQLGRLDLSLNIHSMNTFPEVSYCLPIRLAFEKSKSGSPSRNLLPYRDGFWLNTGYPNPGFMRTLKNYAKLWEHSILPICVPSNS